MNRREVSKQMAYLLRHEPSGMEIEVEQDFPEHLMGKLKRRGHEVSVASGRGAFGRGQIIFRHGKGLVGATEPRTDGQVAVY